MTDMTKTRRKTHMQDEIIPPIHDGQPNRNDFMMPKGPDDKMSDEELLERMNQIYGEYTLYWNEYSKRRHKKRETPKVMSDGRGGVYTC